MSFCAKAFSYWRGSITYRLDVVCSDFHRGKYGIFYEPNVVQHALINASVTMNKNFLKVIDIQETQSVEFTVNYTQPYPWLTAPALTGGKDVYGAGFSGSVHGEQYCNGYWAIVPFTKVQSPDASPLSFNLYIKGHDLQFNFVTADNLPQIRSIAVAESANERCVCPVDSAFLDLNPAPPNVKGSCEYNFGEAPISFRALLKRYVTTHDITATAGAGAHQFLQANLPVHDFASPAYGAVANTRPKLLWYLPYAFLGMRGGMRKRIRIRNTTEWVTPMAQVCVSLGAPTSTSAVTVQTGGSVAIILSTKGSAQFLPYTNAGVEVELPYYSPNLFHFAFSDDGMGTVNTGEMFTTWIKQYSVQWDSTTASDPYRLSVDTATAEDFTLMRFQGAPYFTAT